MLEPGYYSLFVLHDNQTWEQPTYEITKPIDETEFRHIIEAALGGFTSFAVCDDSDCNPEYVRSFDALLGPEEMREL